MGGRIPYTLLFSARNVRVWETGFGTQRHNTDILGPTNPDVRRRHPAVFLPNTCSRAAVARGGDWGERAGSGSSGRVFAQAAADSRGGDVAAATSPARART